MHHPILSPRETCLHKANIVHNAFIGVIIGVENDHERGILIALGHGMTSVLF
jgi:hypothetical protein